jgi:hypothetical protein
MGHKQSSPAAAANCAASTPPTTIPPRTEPAPSLHRHALECILEFSRQRELHGALCVNTDWHAAVHHMRPLQLLLQLPDQVSLSTVFASSALARHIGALSYLNRGGAVTLEPELHVQLGARMPHLRELNVVASERTDAAVQALIDSVAQLQQLEKLFLHIGDKPPRPFILPGLPRGKPDLALSTVSFAPLARMPNLRWLSLDGENADRLTDAQIHELRAVTQLEHLHRYYAAAFPTSVLQKLVGVPPCPLKLQSLTFRQGGEDEAAVVAHLPSLTHLNWHYSVLPNADMLRYLPQLRELDLSFQPRPPADADAIAVDNARVFDALAQCRALEQLTLNSWANGAFMITEDALATCLPHMPRLRFLRVFNLHSSSLALFRTDALIASLRLLELKLAEPGVGSDELRHCAALVNLEELLLHAEDFRPTPAKAILGAFTPPSASLPRLTKFLWFGGPLL